MASEVLSEFLVRLGFSVDPAQHNRFQDAVKQSNTSVEKFSKGLTESLQKIDALSLAATGAAVSVAAAMEKITRSMADTAYQSDRVHTSISSIRSLDFALRSVGGSAGEAQSELERLAEATAARPGLLGIFGIKEGTDPSQALLQIGQRFRQLMSEGEGGIALAHKMAADVHLSWAEALRLADPRTQQGFQQELQRRQSMGIDPEALKRIAEEGNRNLQQLRQFFTDFNDWLYLTWGPKFNEAVSEATNWLEKHLPELKDDVNLASGAFQNMTTTLTNWWNSLSPSGQRDVETIGAIVFLRTLSRLPLLGRASLIIGIAGAITELIREYEKWKETGASDGLIDMKVWGPAIDAATKAVNAFNNDVMKPLFAAFGVKDSLIVPFEALALYLGGGAFLKAILGGGLGKLLRILAVVPGSGITSKMLGALGIAGVAEVAGVVAGAEIGKTGIATPEQEEAAKHPPKLDKEMMTPEQASQRIQEDWTGINEQPQGFLGRAWQGVRGFMGLGGSGKLDPGQAHTGAEIAQYFQAMGWTQEQSEGVAANAIAESGGRPRAHNADHIGLFQWDKARQQTFARMFNYTMTDPSISEERLFRDELTFANWELHNTESIAGKKLAAATTRGEAAGVVTGSFERPFNAGTPELAAEQQKRAGMAEQIHAASGAASPQMPPMVVAGGTGAPGAGAPLPQATAPQDQAAAGGKWTPGTPMWPSLFHGAEVNDSGGAAPPPTAPTPPQPAAPSLSSFIGALGLVRNPDGTIGTPAAGGLGSASQPATAPQPAAPQPAAPQPATAPDITLDVPPIAVPPITLPRVAPVAPPAAVLTVPPAAPPPATVNNNMGDTNHVSQNFAPNITVNGVQEPRQVAQLINRSVRRTWTEVGTHGGSAYA